MTRTLQRTAVLVVMTASLAASAQTTPALTLRAGSDATDTFLLKATDCNLELVVTWTYHYNVGFLCTPLKLWSTEGECGEAPGTNDVRYDDVSQLVITNTRTGTFTVPVAELPGFKSGTETPCGSRNLNKTHKVCGVIEYAQTTCGFTTQPKLQASPLKIVYDTVAPSPPVITDVTALDQSATVTFSADTDSAYVLAEVRAQGSADFVSAGEVVASAGRIKVTGLVNGTTYDLQLRARDANGNVSEPSAPVPVKPIRTVGFWGAYRDAGGTDPGGCSTAPGLVPGLLLLWPLWRRRRSAR
jgi:hypothetical protein